MSCSKEIKRMITRLEKEYNKQYSKEQEIKMLRDLERKETLEERLKTKTIKLNERGKPVTGKKKICEYDCEHCNIICSSDESDLDYEKELFEYKRSKYI